MAKITAHQKDVAEQLIGRYGQPDRMMLEQNNEPYGLVYLAWFRQYRMLFIKPDGTRQLFEGIQKTPGTLMS